MTELRDQIMRKLYGGDLWSTLNLDVRPRSDYQGWNGNHPSLSRLGASRACVVDVGVWKGDSTITLANAMKAAGINGCVIAVDTFLGSPEHYTDPRYINLFGRLNGRPDLYETFLSNVIQAGLQDIVIPLPQTSTTAGAILKHFDIHPDVVHIDAAHEYEDVLKDSRTYFDILANDGFLIGDDYERGWPGVVRAAKEFSSGLGLSLTIEAPKWIVQKRGMTAPKARRGFFR